MHRSFIHRRSVPPTSDSDGVSVYPTGFKIEWKETARFLAKVTGVKPCASAIINLHAADQLEFRLAMSSRLQLAGVSGGGGIAQPPRP